MTIHGRKPTAFAAVVVISVLSLTCAGAAEPRPLAYRMPKEPRSLDTLSLSNENSALYIFNIFDGLVEFAPESLSVIPAVAESWTLSMDGRIYAFKLRKGVRFHNGRAVTADDVVYSLKRALDPNGGLLMLPLLDHIDGAAEYASGRSKELPGLAAPDAGTVSITLKRAYAPFLAILAGQAGSIVPREVYTDPNGDYRSHPVGCGPFRMGSWERGVSIKLEAFREHWKGASGVPGITIRFIESQSTALAEYKTGGLDLLNEVPGGQRRQAQQDHPNEYRIWNKAATAFVFFNHLAAPFRGNPLLRRAVNFAIDRDRISRVLQEDKDIPTSRIIPPTLAGHNPAPGPYRYDAAEAKRLLATAGHPDGKGVPEITFLTPPNESIKRYSQSVQADLLAIGLNVRLQTLDFGAYLEAIDGTRETGAAGAMFVLLWFPDYPDPDGFIRSLFHSSNAGSLGNFGRYSNAEVDRLLDDARFETDLKKREALFQKAEQVALEDGCAAPLYFQRDDFLAKPFIDGFRPSPFGDFANPLELLRMKD